MIIGQYQAAIHAFKMAYKTYLGVVFIIYTIPTVFFFHTADNPVTLKGVKEESLFESTTTEFQFDSDRNFALQLMEEYGTRAVRKSEFRVMHLRNNSWWKLFALCCPGNFYYLTSETCTVLHL